MSKHGATREVVSSVKHKTNQSVDGYVVIEHQFYQLSPSVSYLCAAGPPSSAPAAAQLEG